MNSLKLYRYLRHLTLLLTCILSIGLFFGCCDGEVSVGGRVVDAVSGMPLDSARVTLFAVKKRHATLDIYEDTDSTGSFYLWNMGYCRGDRFFITASKEGYRSQSRDVESFAGNVEVRLEPE